MKKTPRTFIFIGPSAVGKSYAAQQLLNQYPSFFEMAKIFTTRKPRPGKNDQDRLSVSPKKFQEMVATKKFLIHDEFGGNLYGLTRDAFYPKDKHQLINAWPWLSEQLAKLPHTVLIGMQVPPGSLEDFLVPRMRERGDSEETIKVRKKLIKKDTADLANAKDIIEKHGKFFTITDDNTIPGKIIPWIEKEYL